MFASVSRSRAQAAPRHLSAITHRAICPPRRQGSTKPDPPRDEEGAPAGQGEKRTSAPTGPSASSSAKDDGGEAPQGRKKTVAELDEELKKKMSGMAGDGGEAGIEYEDGQPVAMKRSVKNNMFRYI